MKIIELETMEGDVQTAVSQAEEAVRTVEDSLQDFVVASEANYQQGVGLLKEIKARSKAVEELREGLLKPLKAAVQRVDAFLKAPLLRLTQMEQTVKSAMLTWQAEQERKRQEEEARLQKLARVEQERLRKLAERRAEKAEIQEEPLKAEAFRQAVPQIPVPMVPSSVPKAEGVSTRESWHAEVTDLLALVKAVAAGQVPLEAVQANRPYLNGVARGIKSGMTWPGVQAVKEMVMAVQSER